MKNFSYSFLKALTFGMFLCSLSPQEAFLGFGSDIQLHFLSLPNLLNTVVTLFSLLSFKLWTVDKICLLELIEQNRRLCYVWKEKLDYRDRIMKVKTIEDCTNRSRPSDTTTPPPLGWCYLTQNRNKKIKNKQFYQYFIL